MRRWTSFLIIALAACGAGDDTADGTRSLCAEGGALNDQCVEPITTPRDACWRLVDCGAIPVHRDDPFDLDWDRCVDDLTSMDDVQQQLVIACIGASTCDQLRNDSRRCRRLGEN
ncbi:MAG TPA: hypothetical protein VLB44_11450 [Kofleriaceae bacterium]|nr:hypothetical protein [Kofleriaceae bacterium]